MCQQRAAFTSPSLFLFGWAYEDRPTDPCLHSPFWASIFCHASHIYGFDDGVTHKREPDNFLMMGKRWLCLHLSPKSRVRWFWRSETCEISSLPWVASWFQPPPSPWFTGPTFGWWLALEWWVCHGPWNICCTEMFCHWVCNLAIPTGRLI